MRAVCGVFNGSDRRAEQLEEKESPRRLDVEHARRGLPAGVGIPKQAHLEGNAPGKNPHRPPAPPRGPTPLAPTPSPPTYAPASHTDPPSTEPHHSLFC